MSDFNNLPQSINTCVRSLSAKLPLLITQGVFSSPTRQRAIRSDFTDNIRKVLIFLVKHYDIVTGQLVFPVSNDEYTHLTPAIVAERTGLCGRTVKRIFAYLLSVGLLGKEQQQRPRHIPTMNGEYLLLSSIARRLEDKLFAVLGLLPLLRADRAGRLNRILRVKRQVAKRFVLHKATEAHTLPKRPATPPRQQGPTSLRDIFQRMKAQGIPIPSHLL